SRTTHASRANRLAMFPFRDRDRRALAGFRVNLKLIGQAPRAAESETETRTAGKSVLQCPFDVGNAGSLIDEADPQAFAYAVDDHAQMRVTAPAVEQRIACQLACGRDELRLIDEREALRDRLVAHDLPQPDDFLVRAQADLHCQCHRDAGWIH